MYADRSSVALPTGSLRRVHALGDRATLDGQALAVQAHDANGEIRVEHRTIADGDAGTRQTVAIMRELILQGAVCPIVRGQAVAIARQCAPRDYVGQCNAIRAWVSRHVVFMRDPANAELLHTPELLVISIHRNPNEVIHVDCDDVAILAGALGQAVGLCARIVTVAFRDPSNPPRRNWWGGFDDVTPFAHTWCELAPPVGSPLWVDMDTTRTTQGVDPSLIARSFTVDV